MSIESHVHDGSAWRKAKRIYVHDGAAWRDCKEAWCHDGAAWRKVFARGYWELLISSNSGLPSGYQYLHPTVFGGEYYVVAATVSPSATREFGVFKWNGTAWAQVGSYVSVANWEDMGYLFPHNGELWIASTGGGFTLYKISGGSISLVTTNYGVYSIFSPSRGICSDGTDLYVVDVFAAGGGAVQKWNGSWSSVGTVYEAQSVCVFGGSLYVVGSTVSGGSSSDFRIKKWSGAAWVDQTYGGDPSNAYLFSGTSDLYAVNDTYDVYQSTGGAFGALSGVNPADNYVSARRDSFGGIPILGVTDGSDNFNSARGSTLAKLITDTADVGNYIGLHEDGGTLYRTSYNSPPTITVWRYAGDLP
jgi:hypothetical protein